VATMLGVAACGSTPANSPGSAGVGTPESASPHSGHGTAVAVPPPPLRPGERFLDLKMSEPYKPSPPNGGTDDYRCVIVDPHLGKPQFMTGAQFQPKNTPLVHHVVMFSVPPQNASLARAKDAQDPGEGWTCFGDDGLSFKSQSTWVNTWTPNGTETVLKQDVGFPLAPGGLMVMQIHYNLLAASDKAGESDQSSVRLRLTDGTAATEPLDTVRLTAPTELPCTASESGPLCDRATSVADVADRFGAATGQAEAEMLQRCGNGNPVPGNTQHCDIRVPRPATVYAALGHMHLLGRSIKIELNPGSANATTLLDVPAFNYDDQKFQQLPSPITVKAGDTVRVTCTHDAGLRKLLPQLRELPPRYVVWGDGTSDEMCLGLLLAGPAK